MKEIFAVSLASMQQDMSRLDRVAQNLANVSTPGYKREVVAARPFADLLATEAAPATSGGEHAPASMAPPAVQVLTDARPGTLKVTNDAFDVALVGDGFFEVQTDQGLAYTRQGNLHVDARGRLVTAQGHPVMGLGGEIVLTTRAPAIDATGRITEPLATSGESGAAVAQLKVVTFEDPKTMVRLGDGLLAAGAGLAVVEPDRAGVRQGALENANVDSLHEMVSLMQTMRHFESMQKVVQGYDELLGTAIRKLGDLS